ncbi:MAG: NtaA/DmoA family FMN-dependent monooxygenase [Rhizobiales bacterium]|nr:NtaA/DmoA family FMN-dependent monooxygenase [Hyphomicrobiales bacterium]
MSTSERIHLAADLSFVHSDHVWHADGSWAGYPYYGDPAMYEDITRIASRGCFDLLFFGDAGETPEAYGGDYKAAVRYGVRWPKHDMTPLIPLMARAAPGVGFGLTMSTTYHHPFHVARLFNALDHVTGGRVAWNAVTSAYKNEAANYGFDTMIPHDERYVRATEHLQIVVDLWNSVEKDAIVMDRASGTFADPEKVHLLNHRGKYFNVRGPLPVVPSPQGRPVMIQAGQSGPGMELAARFADMQFVQRRTAASMKEHRATLDAALVAQGRSPRDIGILWLTRVQVSDSKEEARAKEKAFLDSLPLHAGLLELSTMYGVDFSSFPPSMRMRDTGEFVKSQNVAWGSFEELLKTADPDITVEEFGRGYITGRALVVTGTPVQIADEFERLHFESGANGGFILAKGFSVPGYLREFVERVVPELQRRGLAQTRYAHPTLRENLCS